MSKKDLNENIGGYVDLKPINKLQPTNLEGWEAKFKNFIIEEKKKDEAVKVEEKKPSKHVEEVASHNFDYSDKKNLDNQIGQEVMNGVYLEAKENPDKSIDEIKEIVSKNLAKDPLHYVKEGQFGVKGLGYTEQKSEEVSGKHKSSGYSDKLKTMVKESLMGGGVVTTGNPNSFAAQQAQMINAMMQEQEDADSMPMDEESYDEGQMMKDKESSRMEAELEEEKEKEVKKDKKGKAKKESIQGVMSRIERVGSGVALEAKIDAIDEEINVRNERLTMLDENDAMAELMDKGKLKELRKDMKMLEKQKAKYAKMYEKCTGKAYTKNEIVDETNI